jgi:hypothetical protein
MTAGAEQPIALRKIQGLLMLLFILSKETLPFTELLPA